VEILCPAHNGISFYPQIVGQIFLHLRVSFKRHVSLDELDEIFAQSDRRIRFWGEMKQQRRLSIDPPQGLSGDGDLHRT
jgi:hypothetical protein